MTKKVTCPFCETAIQEKDINTHMSESYACAPVFDATKLQLMNITLDWDLAISFFITPNEGLVGTRPQVLEGKISEYGYYLKFKKPTKPAIVMNTLLHCFLPHWNASPGYTQIRARNVVFEKKIEAMNLKDGGFWLIDLIIPYQIYVPQILPAERPKPFYEKRDLIMEKTKLNIALQHPAGRRISIQNAAIISEWLKKW